MVFKQGFLKTSIGQTNKCRNKLSPLVSVSSWSEYFNFYGIWTLIKLHCENGVNVLVPHPYKMTPHFSGHHIYSGGKWYFCLSMSCHVWIAHREVVGIPQPFTFTSTAMEHMKHMFLLAAVEVLRETIPCKPWFFTSFCPSAHASSLLFLTLSLTVPNFQSITL